MIHFIYYLHQCNCNNISFTIYQIFFLIIVIILIGQRYFLYLWTMYYEQWRLFSSNNTVKLLSPYYCSIACSMVMYSEEMWMHVLITHNKKKIIPSAASNSLVCPFFIIWAGLYNKALISSCVKSSIISYTMWLHSNYRK